MSYAYPADDQAKVARIIRRPAFKQLLSLPVLPWQEIGIVVGSYTTIIGGAALFINGVLPYPLVLILSGLAVYAIFTPLHDSTHRSVSRVPWINDLIGTLAAQPMVPGVAVSLYRYLHLEHHRHTGNPTLDPDEPLVSGGFILRPLRCIFVDVLWARWYLGQLERLPFAAKARDAVSFVIYMTWHIAWLTSPFALEFVLLWMLPQRLGLLITAYLFAAIQHPEGVLEHEQPFQATRLFKGGWLAHVCMISQSQHLMHHLFPMLPYYRYNAAWKLAAPELASENLLWDVPVGPLLMPPEKPLKQDALLTVSIEKVEAITDEISAYTLRSVSHKALPPFAAGAHVDVHIAPNLVRQYSLTGLAADGQYSIAVKREDNGRGGSRTLHQQFQQGRVLQISQPRNLFALQDDTQHAVLIAGGIGATPIISMAQTLHAQSISFEYHACARDAAALPFAKQLAQLPWAKNVQTWLDGDGGLQANAIPQYTSGHQLYLCGPSGFMDYVKNLAQQRGWPQAALHSEAFSAPQVAAENNEPFTVELARSGKTIEVDANTTLLDALQAEHVPITASCMQGLCGTCKCTVLKGEVEHRDQIFSADEHAQGAMTSCVSRAAQGQRLVLDL